MKFLLFFALKNPQNNASYHLMVEYALSEMDNKLFVSTYMLHLPDKQKLKDFTLKSYFLTSKIIKSSFVKFPFEMISFNEFEDNI